MQLEINDKNYKFVFGIGFVRELNKLSGLTANGVSMGMGLQRNLPALAGYDPSVLVDVLVAANLTETPRIGTKALDDYLMSLEEKDLEKLFADTIAEIKESNATKLVAKKLLQ